MRAARTFWFCFAGASACAAIGACSSDYGGSNDVPDAGESDARAVADSNDGTTPTPDVTVLPECPAQRVVHIVNGNAGLPWYGLVWPNTVLIDTFQAGQKYDDTKLVAKTIPDDGDAGSHPLYERLIAGRQVWQGVGEHPLVSVFVSGMNQTLTNDPNVVRLPPLDGGTTTDVLAAGSIAQAGLASPLTVLAFYPFYWVQVDGGPPRVDAANIDAAIAAIRAKRPISGAEEQELRPDPSKLATWYDATVANVQFKTLAEDLLFTANAFRMGLVSTVLIRGLGDDPQNAFMDVPTVTKKANNLGRVLDAFYIELAKSNEKACGHSNRPLSLADNVLTIVSGDTPDTVFNTDYSWPNGSPGNLNLLYVRSNGFLRPGWFGRYLPTARVNFDPATGALVPGAPTADTNNASMTAALLGIYYAITRGDAEATRSVRDAPYEGVVTAQ